MSRGSADQPKTPGQVNVYWRRRVIALAAGLGMLALVTWTVNGALAGGPRQATDLSQTTSQHPGRPSTPPATSSPSPAASPGGTASATPSPTVKPTPSSSATGRAAAQRHPAGRTRKTAAGAPWACPHAGLVLSLFSARYRYPVHAQPEFDVDVVSTASGRCSADLGASHLHVVIRSGGKQIWDSADCAGLAPRATTLARGVPATVPITWNRKTSAPGCRAAHRAVRPGTYTATAYLGNLSSRAMTLVLKAR
jgi:hypothetical protein